ncbi:hypothetical protein ACFQX6_21835 [Streptosporangium lutulentum]
MKHLQPESARVGVLAVAIVAATVLATASPVSAQNTHGPGCLDSGVSLSVEENRLDLTLPDGDNPLCRSRGRSRDR